MDAINRELEWCMSTERVNTEVMFIEKEDGVAFINIRLRPYKGGRQEGRMVLAGGQSIYEALYYAYTGLVGNYYIPLDWSARTDSVGLVTEVSARVQEQRPTRRTTIDASKRYDALVSGSGVEAKNGHSEATQEHTAPISMAGRNKPKN